MTKEKSSKIVTSGIIILTIYYLVYLVGISVRLLMPDSLMGGYAALLRLEDGILSRKDFYSSSTLGKIMLLFYTRHPEALVAAADLAGVKEDWNKVAQYYALALTFDPHNHQLYLRLGEAYHTQKQYQLELNTYKRLLSTSGVEGKVIENVFDRLKLLGKILYEQQEYSTLFQTYAVVLDLDPFNNEVFLKEYRITEASRELVEKGERDKAISLLLSYLRLWKGSKIMFYASQKEDVERAWLALASLLETNNETERRWVLLREFPEELLNNLQNPDIYRLLSGLYIGKGDLDHAELLKNRCVQRLGFPWCATLFANEQLLGYWRLKVQESIQKGDLIRATNNGRLALFVGLWRGDLYIELGRILQKTSDKDGISTLIDTCLRVFVNDQWCFDIGL